MNKNRVAFLQKDWEDHPGLLWISAVLLQNGFDTRVWVEERSCYEEIREFDPILVAYTCRTGEQNWLLRSVSRLKAAGIQAKTIAGGPHPTFFPDMIKHGVLDAICRGEGEYALLDYVKSLQKDADACDIPNITYFNNGNIIENPLRPLVQDLDELPFPDRSYYSRYPFLATNPFKIFITSRGCPFQCTFCFNHAFHGLYGKSAKYIRRRSVENVIAEIVDVSNRWGIREIRFSDDHFALDLNWLAEFAEAYRNQVAKPYSINARADALDEPHVDVLKRSGCRLVCFGIESGSETARNSILKKNISNESIHRTTRLLKTNGIRFLTSNILGLPRETTEEAWDTIHLNQNIGTDFPWFSLMQYFPGTQIYESAKRDELLSDNYDPDRLGSYFSNNYLQQDNMDEIRNIHSFSILCAKWPKLEPLAKLLTRAFKPNCFFRFVFLLSYLWLTYRRTDLRVGRILAFPRTYWKMIR